MFEWAMKVGKEPLDSTTKLVSALGCLEEIKYWDTAGVVVPWAWTDRFMVATDHDAWEIIGPETLKFYRTRGTERLDGLLGRFASGNFCGLSRTSGQNTSCQVAGVRLPVRIRVGGDGLSGVSRIDLRRICQAFQLRKSYQLFGLDLTT